MRTFRRIFILPVLFLLAWCATNTNVSEITDDVVSLETGHGIDMVEYLQNREPTKLVVEAKFTQEFIDNYRYEESCNYSFALWVDVKW